MNCPVCKKSLQDKKCSNPDCLVDEVLVSAQESKPIHEFTSLAEKVPGQQFRSRHPGMG